MNRLSASRIKTLEDCSWIYWCNYVLKLPDKANAGSSMGSVCHDVFELLGDPKHKGLYEEIVKHQTIKKVPAIERYCRANYQKRGFDPDEKVPNKNKRPVVAIDLISEMIVTGVCYDFFGEEFGELSEGFSEQWFDIEHKDGDIHYHICGFIDKLFLFKKECMNLVRDFKSSKNMFCQYEIENNVQSLIYQLAVRHLYPDYVKSFTQFQFLQYPEEEGIMNVPPISDEEIEGFEHYLTALQEIVDNFSEADARSNFAYNKGELDGEYYGFAGRAKCSCHVSTPYQKKKDGTPMWSCQYKFARNYFVLLNEKGKIKKTADHKKELPTPKKGEKIEKRFYGGCPVFADLAFNRNARNRFEAAEAKKMK